VSAALAQQIHNNASPNHHVIELALARKGTSTIYRQEERNETVEVDEEEEGGG